MSLLGLAGSSAAAAASWMAPLLVAVSAALLGRAHYVLYVRRQGNRFSLWMTWGATCFVVGYWVWYLATGITLFPFWAGT